MSQPLVTKAVTGTASGVKYEIEDGGRKYLGLYAQSGTCVVSLDDVADHDTNAITILEGNIFEPSAAGSEVNFSGDGNTLLIITNRDSKHMLLYDNLGLTYDGQELWYNQIVSKRKALHPPVFA